MMRGCDSLMEPKEKNMKRWTQDYRYIVWTVTDGTDDRYDLYVGGVLKYTNLPFSVFYPIYKAESSKVS